MKSEDLPQTLGWVPPFDDPAFPLGYAEDGVGILASSFYDHFRRVDVVLDPFTLELFPPDEAIVMSSHVIWPTSADDFAAGLAQWIETCEAYYPSSPELSDLIRDLRDVAAGGSA